MSILIKNIFQVTTIIFNLYTLSFLSWLTDSLTHHRLAEMIKATRQKFLHNIAEKKIIVQ